jgi:hypothetical protein
MIRALSWLVALLAIGGCAFHQIVKDAPLPYRELSGSLWRIRITHRDKARFSGIIGLEKRGEAVYSVLLDATGLPLLEGLTGIDGKMKIISCVEEVRRRGLPEVIASMLSALYLTPAREECRWYEFGCTMWESGAASPVRLRKSFGPLDLWRIDLIPNEQKPRIMVFSVPYQSLMIELQQLREEGDDK